MPEIPPAGETVWAFFWELDLGRSIGMEPNPLSWSDILAWQTLANVKLQTWEVRAIKMMDLYRLDPARDEKAKPAKLSDAMRALAKEAASKRKVKSKNA